MGLVHSMKAALTVLNDGRSLTDDVLLTTITEPEDLINFQTLMNVGLEPETEEALTLNHFIRGVDTLNAEHSIPPISETQALWD